MNMASLYRRSIPRQPVKPYRVMVTWHDGRKTCEAEDDDPRALAGAPTVARNARSIARIELHGPPQRGGSQASAPVCVCLETIWASHWVGYQTADREPAYQPVAKPPPSPFVTALENVSTRD